MRYLLKLFLFMLIFSTAVDCYSQNIRGLAFLQGYEKGLFTGALVTVEDGTQVAQLSLISVKHENLLKSIESKYGKIIDVLWLGELETEVKQGQAHILRINENSGTIGENPELYKNASVKNIYNYFLSHELTKGLVSPKPRLIKYNEKVTYVHLGVDPADMSKFRHGFTGLAESFDVLIKYADEGTEPDKNFVSAIRGKAFSFINRLLANSAKISVMTGLSEKETDVVFGLLFGFAVDSKELSYDELKILSIIFEHYRVLQLFPEYYEVAFNPKINYSFIETRKARVREKLLEYTGSKYQSDEILVYELIHKIIAEDEKDKASFTLGPISDLLAQDGVLEFILESPKANDNVAKAAQEFVDMYKEAKRLKAEFNNDYFEKQEQELENKEGLTENSVYIMQKMIDLNMKHPGMTMNEVLKRSPLLFKEANLIYILDKAKESSSKNEEKVLMAQVESIIAAKRFNGLEVSEVLDVRYKEISKYLNGEKDKLILEKRLREHNFTKVSDAVTSLISQGGVLWKQTEKLLFGTKERDFEDGLYKYMQRYNRNVDLKNKFFLLTLLVLGNEQQVKTDHGSLNVVERVVEVMKLNHKLFNEFLSFKIEEESIKYNVKLEIIDAIKQREDLRIKVELKESRFK